MLCPAALSMTVSTVVIMPKKKSTVRATAGTGSGGKQRIHASANGMENVGSTEAKDRTEPVTMTDDRLALWNALVENRWSRKQKLLPNLRLTYPSDDESRTIAELAEVNNAWRFARTIESNILDAHLNHNSFRTLSIPQVKGALKRVSSEANRFAQMLGKLDVGRGSRGSEDYAGWLIELELAFQQSQTNAMVLIPTYIDLLGAFSVAAQSAEQRPIRVPKGAGGNPAFDQFIEDLLMAARMLGGHWTNYRLRDGTWKGTLLATLGILKRYLPEEFFPPGELGRSVEHIRKKLKDHIRRAPQVRVFNRGP
jgi:hypothetical protein